MESKNRANFVLGILSYYCVQPIPLAYAFCFSSYT
eukprot:UN11606